MYNEDIVNNSFNKFIVLVDAYLEELNKEYFNVNRKISNNRVINNVVNFFSVENIIKYKDRLISLDDSLQSDIEILQFLYENEALETEQARSVLDNIKNNKIFNINYDNNFLEQEKDSLSIQIDKCNRVLSGEYRNDELIELFEEFNISEEEQINILTKIIIVNCKAKDNQEVKEKVNVENLVSKYSKLNEDVKNLVESYYFLIKGKDESYINYIKEMCQYIKESKMNNTYKEESNFNYEEESLTLLLIGLLGYKEEVDNLLKLVEDRKANNEVREEIELLLEIIEDEISNSKILVSEYEEVKRERENDIRSNVSILINDNLEYFYDDSSFVRDDYKKINKLIEKFEKGIHDYERGIQHTRVQTDYKDYKVFINKSSDMCASYIRINNEQVLIINFGKIDTIYDDTCQILIKYRDLIKNTIDNILNSDKKTIMLQEVFKSTYLKKGVNKEL